jgi:uncharacterized membrane protein
MPEPRPAQTPAKAPRYSRDQSEFDRAIAFIDAVFAVALTLLITGLDVNDPSSAFRSLSALADAVGAQFISFVIAFTVIASYWLIHHRMVASFVALDTATITTNLCLLATIVLLPFSTASVGDPSTTELPLATALMAFNVAAVSTLYTVVWIMASRRRLLEHAPTSGEWRQNVLAGLAPAAVFLVSIPIAYLASPNVARLSWLALIVVNPVVAKLAASSTRTRAEG